MSAKKTNKEGEKAFFSLLRSSKLYSGNLAHTFFMEKFTEIKITTEYITLGQFLKFADIIQEGGEAKAFLAKTEVLVNGENENRRGRKLRSGDEIAIHGKAYRIA